ncbi:MAG: adenine deaminase [Chitinophagales bacterium]|nr:adenine deaminase [Chitinophagales bacterium]
MKKMKGNIVDLFQREIFYGIVIIENDVIVDIQRLGEERKKKRYILPGFVDAHIHIESSMLTPVAFSKIALKHGTVATVSDPHEIANVCGMEGIQFMLDNATQSPLKFYFGAPSCVPATSFETAGAEISLKDIQTLFNNPNIKYLSEMMNFPGVLHGDKAVLAKIKLAKKMGKQVDGHAPGLRGEDAKKYAAAGITTDHECFIYEEALEKITYGMHILIREGSAAKNFDALIPLMDIHPDKLMFCSDDKHPNDLEIGHINLLVKRSLKAGYNIFDVLNAACINPVQHYGLEVGTLKINDFADFIIVNNIQKWKVLATFIRGKKVFDGKEVHVKHIKEVPINNFGIGDIAVPDIAIYSEGKPIKVIEAREGQLITGSLDVKPLSNTKGELIAQVEEDILKIVVVNRYFEAKPAVAFIKNFGLKKGAIASSVAHDSHNIVAVGVKDSDIVQAVNAIINCNGGLSVAHKKKVKVLPLPLAGIMSVKKGHEVAKQYIKVDKAAKKLGTKLHAPFMTLSFMALLVIPSLKLSDKGLFDGDTFQFTSNFID